MTWKNSFGVPACFWRNEKGQGIALDFLFAVLVFLLVLNASISLMDLSYESDLDKSLIVDLQAKAAQTIDALVRTEGSPSDWQNRGIGEASLIGLAKRDRALDEGKVNKFVEWANVYGSENYEKTRALLLIGYDYHFRIISSAGATRKEAPSQATQPSKWNGMTAVRAKRIVNFNGDEAIAEFTIYYPQ